ncbi:YidH family protein [Thalassiella azotivora]
MQSPRGWLDRLLAEGDDPDPRFTMANERTFLAWIRTSLALVAGGIGLEAFAGDALPVALRQVLAILLLVVGAVLAMTSFSRWLRSERALRNGRTLPGLGMAPLLAVAVAVCAGGLLVGVLVGGG